MSVSKSILCVALAVSAMAGRVMAQAADATEDIRGPKPPVEIPKPEGSPFALWAAIAGGVLLLALAVLLWRRAARKKHLKTPREAALASLAELDATRDRLAAEAFAIQAAGTVRQYIADRFGLAAPRRTTEEFFRELAGDGAKPILAENDHLKTFLKSCDLAKFAGSNLDADQRGELLQAARDFIRATDSNTNPAAP